MTLSMNDCDSKCGEGKISVNVKIVIKFLKKEKGWKSE